jgi:hypothetical protein
MQYKIEVVNIHQYLHVSTVLISTVALMPLTQCFL